MASAPRITGVLLAAGSGRRYGMPKALVDTGSGPWVLRALKTLAPCPRRLVVVGASADEVAALLPTGVPVLVNDAHDSGMGSSLHLALDTLLRDPDVDAAMVMLVDLPDVPVAAVARVAAVPADRAAARSALVRSGYHGRPGHPVLLGRDHFAGVLASASADSGARDYLSCHEVLLVECGDLAGGEDIDVPGR